MKTRVFVIIGILAFGCSEKVCRWSPQRPAENVRLACASAMAGDAAYADTRFSLCMENMGYSVVCEDKK
jgi:hypothetical protein